MTTKPTSLLMPPFCCATCLVLCAVGGVAYGVQVSEGLSVTGLSRSFSWGLYISQFTFMVGVAAGAVMVALPLLWHGYAHFRPILPLAELLAAVSVFVSMCFLFVDLGQPQRMLYVLLHPSPSSLMFWDMLLLVAYGALNLVLAVTGLRRESNRLRMPRRASTLASIGIVMAFAIHTVTGFLYGALPGRPYWQSALTVPIFLASAFCTGPAVLLLALLAADARGAFRLKPGVTQGLSTIITYAMCAYLFFHACELFGAFYSGNPQRGAIFRLLYLSGKNGPGWLTMGMWLSTVTALLSCFLLLFPSTQRNHSLLACTLAMLLVSVWLDKGVAFLATGFTVDVFGGVQAYSPAVAEYAIVLGVYALGALLLTFSWRAALCMKRKAKA